MVKICLIGGMWIIPFLFAWYLGGENCVEMSCLGLVMYGMPVVVLTVLLLTYLLGKDVLPASIKKIPTYTLIVLLAGIGYLVLQSMV